MPAEDRSRGKELGCRCGQQSHGPGRREVEASDALQGGWGFLFKAFASSFSWHFCRKVAQLYSPGGIAS